MPLMMMKVVRPITRDLMPKIRPRDSINPRDGRERVARLTKGSARVPPAVGRSRDLLRFSFKTSSLFTPFLVSLLLHPPLTLSQHRSACHTWFRYQPLTHFAPDVLRPCPQPVPTALHPHSYTPSISLNPVIEMALHLYSTCTSPPPTFKFLIPILSHFGWWAISLSRVPNEKEHFTASSGRGDHSRRASLTLWECGCLEVYSP